ncbi:MAG TPA: hypothetical protein VL137_06790 [Polyangiaceae bacterium]|nr:hypothetical protein [Polyangiaceae bacterium]
MHSSPPSPVVAARVETRELPERPSLHLVVRDAEPGVTAVLAVSVEGGARVAIALASLTEQRLRQVGLAVWSKPHGLGYMVGGTYDSASEVQRFIVQAVNALLRPVAVTESLTEIRGRVAGARLGGEQEGEMAANSCSAEAIVPAGRHSLPADDATTRTLIETWRAAQTADASALALVGPSGLLQGAADVLQKAPALPLSPNNGAQRDPWPAGDTLSASATEATQARLSVALRTADPGRSLASARSLGSDPFLSQMAEGLDPPWHVDRISAIARPRGACLRVDLQSEPGASPNGIQVAALSRLVEASLRTAVEREQPSQWVLSDAVTANDNPVEAAQTAAWLGLSGKLPSQTGRVAVHYAALNSRAGSTEPFLVAHNQVAAPKSALIPARAVHESGQTSLEVLLASPCGTAGERSAQAGKQALMLTALAQAHSDADLTLTPWITADAVGLLMQVRAQSPGETENEQAVRAARRLAQALVPPLRDADTTRARHSMLEQLASPAPDLSYLMDRLTGEQLSALEPRGSWVSVSGVIHDDIEASRRAFITGPLRIAALTPGGPDQGQLMTDELTRLLAPLRTGPAECPEAPALLPSFGLWQIQTEEQPSAQALLGVPLPGTDSPTQASEAEWTAYLMNRKGGWLEKHLITPGLVTSASAQLYGGQRGRALIIELHTLDQKTNDAVQKARELLLDLSRGAATQNDADAAASYFAQEKLRLAGSRVHRIVQLWQSGPPASLPTLGTLQHFHASVFKPERHLVVVGDANN